jgi:hypothetical protein
MNTKKTTCPSCGKLFTPWRAKRFCSERCRKRPENSRLCPHASGDVTLMTEHSADGRIERRAITRVGDQMYRSTKTKTGGSKTFDALADRPTEEIVKKIGLTDFFVIISARLTGVRSETVDGSPIA